MGHADRFVRISSEEGGIQSDVADVPARDVEPAKFGQIDSVGRRLDRENPSPDFSALQCVRKWKLHDEPQSPQKGGVKCALHVSRENGQATIGLHALEQIADFGVRIAIMAVLDFAALAEECVGLIEKQDGSPFLGRIEYAPQIFRRLADVFTNDLAEIDAVEVQG